MYTSIILLLGNPVSNSQSIRINEKCKVMIIKTDLNTRNRRIYLPRMSLILTKFLREKLKWKSHKITLRELFQQIMFIYVYGFCSFTHLKVLTWYSHWPNVVPKMAVRRARQNVKLILFLIVISMESYYIYMLKL